MSVSFPQISATPTISQAIFNNWKVEPFWWSGVIPAYAENLFQDAVSYILGMEIESGLATNLPDITRQIYRHQTAQGFAAR